MKLDAAEEAMMNEIEISTDIPVSKKRYQPPVTKRRNRIPRPPPSENLDAFTNPVKRSAQKTFQPPPEVVDHGEHDEYMDDEDMYPNDDEGEMYDEEPTHDGGMGMGSRMPMGDRPSAGYTSIDDEKADILNKLTRLEKKGFSVNKKMNIYSNIDELRTEYKRIKYSIEVDQSLKFSRRMLIACVTGVEFLNKRYNPLDVQLEGWSESVMENVDDYDGVFEELYNKYKTKVDVAPEVKLIMMLGGSGMMFHLTNSMFKSAIPNMNDVMKQNPDLIKNMLSAVQNTQSKAQMGESIDPTERPAQAVGPDGRREMRGPGVDLSSLMGGIMMPPPPPMNTTTIQEEGFDDDDNESISDIISIDGGSTMGDVKEVKVRKNGRRSKKKEINM
jgi:hypothetical protein